MYINNNKLVLVIKFTCELLLLLFPPGGKFASRISFNKKILHLFIQSLEKSLVMGNQNNRDRFCYVNKMISSKNALTVINKEHLRKQKKNGSLLSQFIP